MKPCFSLLKEKSFRLAVVRNIVTLLTPGADLHIISRHDASGGSSIQLANCAGGSTRQSLRGCGSRAYADPRGPWQQSSSQHNASAGDAAGGDDPSPSRRPRQTRRCETGQASAGYRVSVGGRAGLRSGSPSGQTHTARGALQ